MARFDRRSPSRRFLPPDPRVAEPHRLTPQLALRIGILGTLVLAVFAVLFLRLWALQVLSGNEYLNAAQNNQLRTVRLQAPRGPILDRNGIVLVDNAPGTSVQLWPADLPKTWPERRDVLRRLSAVLDVPVSEMLDELKEREGDPLSPITIKLNVRHDQVAYIEERRAEFQGATVASSYLRRYPFKALGAQLLGHVGEVSPEQLERGEGLLPGDEVGQAGVESTYDRWLRGKAGIARLRVDSLGRPRGGLVPTQESAPGLALRLTIDARLQQAAEAALREGIRRAHGNGDWEADGGAIVALDPRDGEVLALASNPTFRPSVFVGRVEPKQLAEAGLATERAAKAKNYPGLNRATQGLYPPGSTWKPVTALAAMQEHLLSPYTTLPCTSSYTSVHDRGEEKQVFRNWDPYVDRGMTLTEALAASCDTYFYAVGDEFYALPAERGHPFQAWAARFGFGARTGLDVGPEEAGLIPTPEWRRRTYETEIDRLWKPGDSIQLAIGQKDLLVTPLQMARFYALVANGGKLVTPHLAVQAELPGHDGTVAEVRQRFTPPPPEQTNVDPAALAAVRDGLVQATHYPLGTSAGVFDSFPVLVAGKTGTAEKVVDGVLRDQAWWCGYAPADDPEIVVCALIENGGHGGEVAAPTALRLFEQYFDVEGGPVQVGKTD